jgi:spore germination protein YaaH
MSFSATLLGVIKYRVCPGDSLLSIALQFATTVKALQALNKIGPHSGAIVPNQVGSKVFTSAFNLPLDYSCSARAKR